MACRCGLLTHRLQRFTYSVHELENIPHPPELLSNNYRLLGLFLCSIHRCDRVFKGSIVVHGPPDGQDDLHSVLLVCGLAGQCWIITLQHASYQIEVSYPRSGSLLHWQTSPNDDNGCGGAYG